MGKFLPLYGGRLGGRFYPSLGVKMPTLLFTATTTMVANITFVMIVICFVFQKAWLFPFFDSETFFLFPLYSMRTVPFVVFGIITISCCF